jgi:hypothetical protein
MLGMIHANNHTKVKNQVVTTTTYPSLPLIKEGSEWVLYGESTQVQTTPKNLFNWSTILYNDPTVRRETYLGRDCISYISGNQTTNQKWLKGLFKTNVRYTLSGYFCVDIGTGIVMKYTDGTIKDVWINDTNETFVYKKLTSDVGKTVELIKGNWNSGARVYLDINTIMVEEGIVDTAYTAYTPPLPSANAESPIINTYKKGTYQNTIDGIPYQFELDNDLLQCGTFKDKLTINTVNKTIKVDRNCIQQVLKGDASDGTYGIYDLNKTNVFYLANNAFKTNVPNSTMCNYMKNIPNSEDTYSYDCLSDPTLAISKFFNFDSSTLGIIASDTTDVLKITRLKTWLSARYTSSSLNPFTIQYALATPTSTTRRLTPVTVQSGSNELVIENTVNAPIERLEIDGGTTQVETVQGVNIFDKNIVKTNLLVDNGRNVVDVDITSKSLLIYNAFATNTQYTIQFYSRRVATYGVLTATFYYTDATSSTGNRIDGVDGYTLKTITSTVGKTIDYIKITNGGNGSANGYIDLNTVQIEQNTVATAYTPFVPPSPSPLYPSTLTSVGQSGSFNVISKSANLIQNGNFANGVSGWNYSDGTATITASDNTLFVTGTGTHNNNYCYRHIPDYQNGHKYYFVSTMKVTNSDCIQLYYHITSGSNITNCIYNPVINTPYRISAISIPNNYSYIVIKSNYVDRATATGKVMEVQKVMAIDMGKDSSNPLYNLTQTQMDAKFVNWSDYKQTTINILATLRSLPDGTKDRLVIDKASQTAWIERNIIQENLNITNLYRTGTDIIRFEGQTSLKCVYSSSMYGSHFKLITTNWTGELEAIFHHGSYFKEYYWSIYKSTIGWLSGDTNQQIIDKGRAWIASEVSAGRTPIVMAKLLTPVIEPIAYPNIATIQHLTNLSKDGITSNMSFDVLILGSKTIVRDGLVLNVDFNNIYGNNSIGVNSPLTTTIKNLADNTPLTLNGFGGTTASGYTGNGTELDPYCLVFDGSNDYINCGSSNVLSLACTISVWVKITSYTGTFRRIIDKNRTEEYSFGIGSDNKLLFAFSNIVPQTGATAIPLNIWTMISVTYDGANIKYYINSILDKIVPQTGLIGIGTNSLNIGLGSGVYFGGLISNGIIYNRALSQSEITQNYNVGLAYNPTNEYKAKGQLLTNLITNGNFANGTTGWTPYDINSFTANNYIAKYTPYTRYGGIVGNIANYTNYRGHRLYFFANYKTDSTLNILVLNDATNQIVRSHSGNNTFMRLSGLMNISSVATNLFIKIQDGRESGWTETQCTNFGVIDMGIDLTNPLFNLTVAQMDTLLLDYPEYFEGNHVSFV